MQKLICAKARNGRRLVPLASGLRVLAVVRGHQHAAVLRAAHAARRRGGGGSDPVGQGQGGDRRLPADQPADAHDGPRAAADDVEPGPPEQAVDPGPHPRPEPALLQHRHQLPEDGAGGEHADEPAQAGVDRGPADGRLQGGGGPERGAAAEAGRAGRGLREEGQGGDGADQGAAEDEICGEAGSEEA